MSESPLKILEKLDPDLLKLVENTSKFVLADGALPRKFKLLIAMAAIITITPWIGVVSRISCDNYSTWENSTL